MIQDWINNNLSTFLILYGVVTILMTEVIFIIRAKICNKRDWLGFFTEKINALVISSMTPIIVISIGIIVGYYYKQVLIGILIIAGIVLFFGVNHCIFKIIRKK